MTVIRYVSAELRCQTCTRYVDTTVETSDGVACVLHAVCMRCGREMVLASCVERIATDESEQTETAH